MAVPIASRRPGFPGLHSDNRKRHVSLCRIFACLHALAMATPICLAAGAWAYEHGHADRFVYYLVRSLEPSAGKAAGNMLFFAPFLALAVLPIAPTAAWRRSIMALCAIGWVVVLLAGPFMYD